MTCVVQREGAAQEANAAELGRGLRGVHEIDEWALPVVARVADPPRLRSPSWARGLPQLSRRSKTLPIT
jgi:hypothetical protein